MFKRLYHKLRMWWIFRQRARAAKRVDPFIYK